MNVAAKPRALPKTDPRAAMVWMQGGPFRMGSDHHYPEEAPARAVTVDGFWIDTRPVTNRDFARFVKATGWRTFAEIAPNADDYPGADAQRLRTLIRGAEEEKAAGRPPRCYRLLFQALRELFAQRSEESEVKSEE